jgi:hypothetical protein
MPAAPTLSIAVEHCGVHTSVGAEIQKSERRGDARR